MARTTTTTTRPKFISYRRVSTQEQADSRLGLEAQGLAIAHHVASCAGSVIAELVDVASGNDDDRPQFLRAVELAKRTGASIVVAKLDRLSRAIAVIAGLMRDGVKFTAADRPNASELELHLIAMLAQEERRLIAKRTEEALRALAARGVLLGSRRPGHWDGREDRREAGQRRATEKIAKLRRAVSAPVYAEARAVMDSMPGASLRTIAAELDRRGILTPRGSTWTATAVRRAMLTT